MKALSLFLLRITLGWLMVVWGVDKLSNVEHAQGLAESFYWGIGTGVGIQTVFGYLQVALGLLVVIGWLRWVTWPIMALVNGLTLAAVWESIFDPWGFVLEGGSLVFYSSTIIFAAILVGWAFMGQDRISVDARIES